MKKAMLLALTLALGGLTACGGGDTTPTPTPNPAPNPTPTPTPTAPNNTASVTATVNAADVAVTWVAVDKATSYKVDRKNGTGAYAEIATVDAPTVTYVDKGLAPGTYTYRVRSVNSAGVSSGKESGVVTVAAPIPTPAPMPTKWIGYLEYNGQLRSDKVYIDLNPAPSVNEPPHLYAALDLGYTWTTQSATDVKFDKTSNKLSALYRELNSACKNTSQLVKIDASYDAAKNKIIGTFRSDGMIKSFTGTVNLRPLRATEGRPGVTICVGI